MFQTEENIKEALEQWAAEENRTLSGLINTVLKELLIQKGLIQPPKKLIGGDKNE